MKLLLSSLTAAALALVASATPLAARDTVTTELPAKFALYLVTGEARANGLPILYRDDALHININNPGTSFDGVFHGGRGRIVVDVPPPHPKAPQNLGPSYLYRDLFFDVLRIATEPLINELIGQNWPPHPILSDWVQDDKGILRIIVNGVLQENGIRICGSGTSEYLFWWMDSPYATCPTAELRVVPL